MENMTIERLRSMWLPSMAERYLELSSDPSNLDLPWKDVVAMLVDKEYDSRASK